MIYIAAPLGSDCHKSYFEVARQDEYTCSIDTFQSYFANLLHKKVLVEVIKLTIQIKSIDYRQVGCLISDGQDQIGLVYVFETREISFSVESHLASILRSYHFQFEKIIRSAMKGNPRLGQTIHSVFIAGFNFLKEADFNHFIWVDRRNGKLEISKSDISIGTVPRIYADGAYFCETGGSGYGGYIEMPDGRTDLFEKSFAEGSSNLMELLAVTDGLKRLQSEERIQVNTDSRFVIRGLAQWVHFWQHNNWQTAYGSPVKFAASWQQIDRLCNGKLIELNWIKGHSGNEAQSFCHDLARESGLSAGTAH